MKKVRTPGELKQRELRKAARIGKRPQIIVGMEVRHRYKKDDKNVYGKVTAITGNGTAIINWKEPGEWPSPEEEIGLLRDLAGNRLR